MKIRTPPEIQISASIEALGGVVTQIAFPELYLALSQGVVDGEENPIAVIFFNKYYEVQKHALTKHIYNNMIHTMSMRAYAKLSKEQQAIIREESASVGNTMRRLIVSDEAEQLKKLGELGMQITSPDLAPFKEKMQSAYAKIGAFAGDDNVKKFLDIVAINFGLPRRGNTKIVVMNCVSLWSRTMLSARFMRGGFQHQHRGRRGREERRRGYPQSDGRPRREPAGRCPPCGSAEIAVSNADLRVPVMLRAFGLAAISSTPDSFRE